MRSRLLKGAQKLELSYLYHRHGVSLLMAENAACERSRRAHRTLAKAYACRIADAIRGSTAAAA